MSFVGGFGVGGIGLRARLRPSAAAPLLVQGPWTDLFTTASTGLTGRLMEGGGAPYTVSRYVAGADPFTVGSGNLSGGANTNPQQGFGFVTRDADEIWVRRTPMTLGAGGGAANTYVLASHITVNLGAATASWIHFGADNNTGLITAISVRAWNQANGSTSFGSTGNVMVSPGDSYTERYVGQNGGSPTVTCFLNGQRIINTSAITGHTLTDQHGLRGPAVAVIDEFTVCDPNSDRFIELIAPGKNLHSDAAGNCDGVLTFRVRGGMPAASDLRYSIINEATKLPIAGHDNQPVIGLQTGVTLGVLQLGDDTAEQIGRFTTATLTKAQTDAASMALTDGFFFVIDCLDVTPGSICRSRSPVVRRSVCVVPSGQSLAMQGNSAAGTLDAGAPATTPVDDWLYDCSDQVSTGDLSTNGLPRVRRLRTTSATNASPNKQMAGKLQALTGMRVGIGMSGWGGTFQSQRNASTSFRAALLVGLANMYCRPGYIMDVGGQFEGNTYLTLYASFAAMLADYPAQVAIEHAAIEEICGPVPRYLCPLAMVTGMPDTEAQQIKRLMAVTMPANYPRFFTGPYLETCYRARTANNSTDVYHLTPTNNGAPLNHPNSGYGIQRSRWARFLANKWDPVANPSDLNGPRLTSAVRAGNTITCTFDPNGGTLEFGAGSIGDWRGGLDFLTVPDSLDFNPANARFPTNAVVTGNTVAFNFASLTGPIYICAGRGSRPFARTAAGYDLHNGSGGTGTDAVILDMPNRSSMVRSRYTGAQFNDFGTTEVWVEVQPYWGPSPTINNQDFITVA
ncbi:hypothetical protein [Sandarakinorhabdus sp.]|uniref:hypothetical protein n=1 Tax=Sandarakinorhabdus sp. TaxID=1916663 RepID=UPI00286DC38D|nr:hypothetical protein [Sandarakinorhabdus sp.]